jgi:hypothetical protein
MDLRKRERMGWCGLDWSGSGEGPVEGACEHGNEPSGSIKCWEILEYLRNWRLLKEGSAQWSWLVTFCFCLVGGGEVSNFLIKMYVVDIQIYVNYILNIEPNYSSYEFALKIVWNITGVKLSCNEMLVSNQHYTCDTFHTRIKLSLVILFQNVIAGFIDERGSFGFRKGRISCAARHWKDDHARGIRLTINY